MAVGAGNWELCEALSSVSVGDGGAGLARFTTGQGPHGLSFPQGFFVLFLHSLTFGHVSFCTKPIVVLSEWWEHQL